MNAPATASDRAVALLQFLHEAPWELLSDPAIPPYLLVCALGARDLLATQPLVRCHGSLPFRTSSVRCYQCGAEHPNTIGVYKPYVFACMECDVSGESAAWMRWSSTLYVLCDQVHSAAAAAHPELYAQHYSIPSTTSQHGATP